MMKMLYLLFLLCLISGCSSKKYSVEISWSQPTGVPVHHYIVEINNGSTIKNLDSFDVQMNTRFIYNKFYVVRISAIGINDSISLFSEPSDTFIVAHP